jgi:two-component system response regulator RstA
VKKYQLLIVEDDKDLAKLTCDFFEQFEFECNIENNGAIAINRIIDTQPDIVLLDIMLPEMDGLQICQQVKGKFHGRIVMLTALTDTIDQVLGLEIGADDYVSKPIEPRLLLAKARAVLRREPVYDKVNQETLIFGDIEIHKNKRELLKNGVQIELTNPEYDLLEILMEHSGNVISRDQIFMGLRGVEYDGQNRQVDIHISNLRAKLEEDPSSPKLIKTVRSKGYLFTG